MLTSLNASNKDIFFLLESYHLGYYPLDMLHLVNNLSKTYCLELDEIF